MNGAEVHYVERDFEYEVTYCRTAVISRLYGDDKVADLSVSRSDNMFFSTKSPYDTNKHRVGSWHYPNNED